MKFKNALFLSFLFITQALISSERVSAFGSPCPSPSLEDADALREEVRTPEPFEIAASPRNAGAALMVADSAAALVSQPIAQQLAPDATLSTDDDQPSTDAFVTPSISTQQQKVSLPAPSAVAAPQAPLLTSAFQKGPNNGASLVTALAAQQKNRTEQAALAQKMVKKMVRFKKIGDLHEFAVAVEFDENDASVSTTKISASLWKALQRNIAIRNRVRCIDPLCTHECDAKLNAEDCEVSMHELAPKRVPVKVTLSETVGSWASYQKEIGTLESDYDLHDTDFTAVKEVHTWSERLKFNAIPSALLQRMAKSLSFYSVDASSLTVVLKDLTPEVAEDSAPAPVDYPAGNTNTCIRFVSPTIKCAVRKGEDSHCIFYKSFDSALNKESKEKQLKIARDLVLNSITKGNMPERAPGTAKCHFCQQYKSLAHHKDTLDITVSFPPDWGSA